MSIVINKKHIAAIGGETPGQTESELKKFVNCALMSSDGIRFDIHEKLLSQTQLMCDILEDARDPDCCDTIKIVLICPGEELKKLVQFLYDGKIHCKNEEESLKFLKSLKNLFGFSDDDLECQKILPKSVNGKQKKSLKSKTMIPAAEKMDCEKTDTTVNIDYLETNQRLLQSFGESPEVKCEDTKEPAENTTMTATSLNATVEAMDCSPVECGDLAKKEDSAEEKPVECGDLAKKVDVAEEKGLKKTGNKTFFVPWKPPRTSSKLVLVEDKENQGNQKVLTEL